MIAAFAQSVRTLAHRPILTVTAVLTLGLGIGASTAIFSLLDTVALRPLPYRDADRLVGLGSVVSGLKDLRGISWPKFQALEAESRQTVAVAACYTGSFGLTDQERPEEVVGIRVSGGFFDVFAVAPILGRTFTADEERRGGRNVALLSAGFWRQRFGGDRAVLGRTLSIEGLPTTVVGVLPDVLRFPFADVQLWLPRPDDAPFLTRRSLELGSGYLQVLARVKPGVPLAAAKREIDRIAQDYGRERPGQTDAAFPLATQPLQEFLLGTTRTTLSLLLGAVGLVLLIACADVANLLLADGLARRREIAARMALGAGRRRILGQALRESLLLAGTGGLLGVFVAYWGLKLLVASHPADLPRIGDVALSGRALGFALLSTTVAGLLAGLAPAWQTLQTDPKSFLVYGDRGAVGGMGGRQSGWGQGLLVTGQIALTLVLFSSAALLLRSLERVQQMKLGFAPANLLVVQVTLPAARYPERNEQRIFFESLADRVRGLPGVESAALVDYPPLAGTPHTRIQVEGQAPLPADRQPLAGRMFAGAGYFRTLQTPFLAGHDFDPRLSPETAPQAIVNRAFRDLYFPGQDPVGRHVRFKNEAVEIVGMIEDIQQNPLEAGVEPTVFLHQHQMQLGQSPPNFMNLAIRTALPVPTVAESIKRELRTLDPGQPLPKIETMAALLRTGTARRRLMTGLFSGFSGLALLLAILGIYGVVAHAVTLRRREIGVRMALGASPGRVLEGILGLGARWIVPGLLLGLAGSWFAGRALESQLFDVAGTDPLYFTATAAVLGAIAFLACLLPAQKAARIDPAVTLRMM